MGTKCGVLCFFDELNIGLHPQYIQRLLEVQATLKAHGVALVVIEHDLEIVAMPIIS